MPSRCAADVLHAEVDAVLFPVAGAERWSAGVSGRTRRTGGGRRGCDCNEGGGEEQELRHRLNVAATGRSARPVQSALVNTRPADAYPLGVSEDDLTGLECAVLAEAPPGALVIGASVSPAGDYGATLTFLASANYLMDDILIRTDSGWKGFISGSGGGVGWTSTGGGGLGVVRFVGEAEEGASIALVEYEGREYRVPMRDGYFFFVGWNTRFTENPVLIGFE